MPPEIRAVGIEGLPEVRAGDDLAAQIMDAAAAQGTPIEPGDVVVVTQKIVSKAEGRVMDHQRGRGFPVWPSPSPRATVAIPRHTEMILRESRRVVRMDRGVIISETYHGYICANAGIDASNIPGSDSICLLPVDPDASARRIRDAIRQRLGVDVAVLVSDTFGRPWRNGAINVSIGVAGFNPVISYIGEFDPHGNELHTTTIAVADELAATAELVTGKLLGVPVALVKGYPYERMEDADSRAIVREPDKDLFR